MGDYKRFSFSKMIGCCGCFGFVKKPRRRRAKRSINNFLSHGLLYDGETEGDESFSGDVTSNATSGDDNEAHAVRNRSEDILNFRAENGMVCRPHPVKETFELVRSEDEHGNKMINEYIREYKIGSGSYAKVALYRSCFDGNHYAIKVLIMKMVEHPNIVNLIEVIDDPESDDFYMVLEYVEGKWVCEGTGRPCALGEETARKYLRDIVSGLTYLHAHNIVHGDIKPDNLLITRHGKVKIVDFSVSQAFEDGNDELRRSPGTPVFTAPECCLGLTYHGKASDTWAVGVTLYCMILGEYPFLGDTLQDTYDKIVNDPLVLPDDINPQLKNLIEGLLCKDPEKRMTLGDVAEHVWVIGNDGPLPGYLCWCKRKSLLAADCDESNIPLLDPH
ncbi:serine/threonine-protein kinase GRIK2-like isoform X3 [Vigna umbellata]|uniref:serine/threonine-protein kinase GRIK2 isoform X2 n=1 Tax=Phaseolus angularis TaxID=3914 RepID=UPI00080A0B9A|nr:serine/threonine-protein kinase GRIK2 isoform X2 [Vigna angularis]XP_047176373.1 serine/threonine-protein kinase GRIK2-like isoform X3 [Vigna umbellata]